MEITPFKIEHLESLELQAAQYSFQPLFQKKSYGESLQRNGVAYTAIIDGQAVAIAGVMTMWEGRGIAWAFFSQKALDNFAWIYRAIKRFLSLSDLRRIECFVDCEFANAHRLALCLGFVLECERMRSFTPDGRDCALYVRIK